MRRCVSVVLSGVSTPVKVKLLTPGASVALGVSMVPSDMPLYTTPTARSPSGSMVTMAGLTSCTVMLATAAVALEPVREKRSTEDCARPPAPGVTMVLENGTSSMVMVTPARLVDTVAVPDNVNDTDVCASSAAPNEVKASSDVSAAGAAMWM